MKENLEQDLLNQSKDCSPDQARPKPDLLKQKPRIFSEETSDTIGKLAGALAKAQGQMSNGPKDKQGYGYKYLQLSTLIDIVRGPLSENGLALFQTHELITNTTASVVTHTTIAHESGEWIKSSLQLPITQMKQLSAAQVVGVACTYARRYAIQSLCLVSADEDTDGTQK